MTTLELLISQNPSLSDQEIADLANTPQLTLKAGSIITSATLASAINGVGLVRAAQVRGGLQLMRASGDAQSSALADYILGILDGAGFDPGDPSVAGAVSTLVTAGIISQSEVEQVLYRTSYLLGTSGITVTQVTDARTTLVYQNAIASLEARLNAAVATAANDIINPAAALPSGVVPTWQSILDIINQG